MTLLNFIEAFQIFKLSHIFTGSFAANLNGYMVDDSNLEVMIPQNIESFKKAEKALTKLGYENTLPVGADELFNFLDQYRQKKGMSVWTFQNPRLKSDKISIRLDIDFDQFVPQTATYKTKTILFLNLEETQKLGLRIDAETACVKGLSADLVIKRFENLRFYHQLEAKKEMGKSKLISMKIQQPLLNAFKEKSEFMGVPYQTQIKVLMKEWLK
jgi:predicted DNA binding CopG/RHH family protein